MIGKELEWEVDEIVNSKKGKGDVVYKVKWKGYGPEENTWEPRENLEGSKELLDKYHKKLFKKARDSAKGL